MEEIEEVYKFDNEKQTRWREMISMLFASFFQSKNGDWLISPEQIAIIFLGERSKKQIVAETIDTALAKNEASGLKDGKNIDIDFLSSIISKITTNKEDIMYFNSYKTMHGYYDKHLS